MLAMLQLLNNAEPKPCPETSLYVSQSFRGGMPMSLLYYGDYKFSFNESDRNRSSSLRMTLLVCSAKLRVKIYSQVSASPKRLGVEHHIPCEAEYVQDGQSTPCKSPTHPPS